MTVNHSVEFVNSETHCNSNTNESSWRALKTSLLKHDTQKQLYNSDFAEYCIWHRYLNGEEDKFASFLEIIKSVYLVLSQRSSQKKTTAEQPLSAKENVVLPKLRMTAADADDSLNDLEV